MDSETAVKKLKSDEPDLDKAIAEVAPEPDPAADKKFVIDELTSFTKDGRKDRAMAFAKRFASVHGAKLPDIPAEQFPAIRAEMEKEFALG
jgi:hypothetical protein